MLKCWCENLACLFERPGKLCQLGQQTIAIWQCSDWGSFGKKTLKKKCLPVHKGT